MKVAGLQPAVDPKKVYVVPYYDTGFAFTKVKRPDWPNAKPFTIVISESGPAEPAFDAATREFRITMHKGERARLRVSSILPTAEILSMAVAAMIAEQNPSQADQVRIGLDIAEGQHWMFTPWRVVELVHAVQKPLIKPSFLKPILIERKAGWVHAVPTMVLALNSKSTSKIDVNAKWVEPNDDPAALVPLAPGYVGNKVIYPGPAGQPDLTPADPGIIRHSTRAFELKIARLASFDGVFALGGPPPANGAPDNRPQHVFGDTRYRRVIYEIDATTRFREFMPAAIQADPKDLTVSSSSNEKNAVAWIPNSAAPPAPKLLYVVPTFGWGHKTAGNQSSSWRTGGGLRVYLDRPWFETGFTEMLAVVLPPGPVFHNWAAYGEAQALPPYVTQWGADPAWVSGPVLTVAPQPDAFPLARWRAPIPFEGAAFPAEEGTSLPPGDFLVTGLRVPEMLQTPDVDPASPGELAIAPHPVGYDSERQLWYADIVVRPGNAYYPFIRLALARYNPISVPGAHLSSIVMTEFVQLTPDRLAILTQNADKAHVAIFGVGSGTPLRNGARSGLFEIYTETLAPGADRDLGWQRSTAEGTSGLAQLTPADLLAAAPPLLWQGDVAVPTAPAGTRARLVITESEVFQTAELYAAPTFTGSRVVYLETIELSPNRQIQAPSMVLTTPSQPPASTLPIVRTPPPGTNLQSSVPPANQPPNATATAPPANTRPITLPNFAGDWDVIVGRAAKFAWHLKQRGKSVTGTYAPGNGVVSGTVADNGRLNLSWTIGTPGTRTALSGRGYLDLTAPDTWQGRWWVGASPVDPTPGQPNTWRAIRAPKRS